LRSVAEDAIRCDDRCSAGAIPAHHPGDRRRRAAGREGDRPRAGSQRRRGAMAFRCCRAAKASPWWRSKSSTRSAA